jgi:hypothetical protein
MEHHSNNSSYRERLIEHLFVGELLKLSWANREFSLEVSKPEVDNSGYDLIVEARGIIRHIQLKTAYDGAKTARQNVNMSLLKKPSGCIVWIRFNETDLKLGPFLFFGGEPGARLVLPTDLRTARHTKGDAKGHKAERPNMKVVPKSLFASYPTIEALFEVLFGISQAKINPI